MGKKRRRRMIGQNEALALIPEVYCAQCTAKGGSAPVKRQFWWTKTRQKADEDVVWIILVCGNCKTEKTIRVKQEEYDKRTRRELCEYVQRRYKNN